MPQPYSSKSRFQPKYKSNVLFVSDIQLDAKNVAEFRVVVQDLLRYGKQHDAPDLIVLGDVKDPKSPIPGVVINEAVAGFKALKSQFTSVSVVLGNHDYYSAASGSDSWKSFLEACGCVVFDKPVKNYVLGSRAFSIIPYQFSNKEFREQVELMAGSGNVLLFHQGISGAQLNMLKKAENENDPAMLGKFPLAIGGDYHHQHKIEGTNVWYCGSPFCSRWDEANQTKGYLLLSRDYDITQLPSSIPGWYDPSWPGCPDPIPPGSRVRVPMVYTTGTVPDAAAIETYRKDIIAKSGCTNVEVKKVYKPESTGYTASNETDEQALASFLSAFDPEQATQALEMVRNALASAGAAGMPTLHVLSVEAENLLGYESLRFDYEDGMHAIVGLNGTGKAQPVDTKVATPEGWKRIGDIQVGDFVIGSDGKPTKVRGVFPQGIKPCSRVTLTDYSTVIASDTHLWQVIRKSHGKPVKHVVTTNELRVLYKDEIPMLKAPIEFYASDPLINGYELGYMVGNGCFTKDGAAHSKGVTVTVGTEDVDEVIKSFTAVSNVYTRGTSNALSFIAKYVQPMLAALNLWGAYSHEKFIPRECFTASVNYRIALLQGLMDSDGCCRSNRLTFSTASQQLALDMVELVQCLGGIARVQKPLQRDGKSTEYTVSLRLPNSVLPFRLKRKLHLYKPTGAKARPCHSVREVKSVPPQECVCIMVEAADHLYVTENAILTHNSTILHMVPVILFGENLKGQSATELRRERSKGKSWGRCVFTGIDGVKMEVYRERAPGTPVKIWINGEERTTGRGDSEIKKLITAHTGFTLDTLKAALFVDQREVSELLSGKPGPQQALLNAFCGLDRYVKALDFLKTNASATRAKAAMARDKHTRAETFLAAKVEERFRAIQINESERKTVEAVVETTRELLSQWTGHLQEREAIAAKLASAPDLRLAQRKLDMRFTTLRSEQQALLRVKDKAEPRYSCPTCGAELSKEKQKQLREAWEKELHTARERYLAVEAECKELTREITGMAEKVKAQADEHRNAAEAVYEARSMVQAASAELAKVDSYKPRPVPSLAYYQICEYLSRMEHEGYVEDDKIITLAMSTCQPKTGVPSMLVQQLIPRLNAAAVAVADQLETKVVVSFNAEDGGLKVQVTNEDGGTGFKAQSNGEAQLASLSTTLALRSLVDSNLLVLDEPSIGLDGERAPQLAEVINGLRALYRCILVVSHDTNFAQYLQGARIWRTKKQNGICMMS